MNDINKRILQIAEYHGISKPADFARRTGFSHQVASNYLKATRVPTVDALCTIKRSFDVDADWLLTGVGNMLKDTPKNSEKGLDGAALQADPRDIELIASKNEVIESQKDIIETQKELISSLRLRIKELESRTHTKVSAFSTAHSVDTSNLTE